MENVDRQELDQLTLVVIDGFDSLYEEVQLLSYKNRMLEDKLSATKRMYQALADKYAPYDDEDTHRKTYELETDDGQDEKSYQFNEPIRWTKVSLRGQNGKKDAQARKAIKTGITARNKMAEILGSSHGLSLPLHVAKSEPSDEAVKEGSISQRSELPPPSHAEQDFTIKRGE
ncbi:MAG: hypothetical protein M1835_007516, partial [Candelina submexicana]